MPKPRERDPLVDETLDIFQWAFRAAQPFLNAMDELQRAYDAEANPNTWPTISKVPVPVLFNMVEKALPNAVDGLFPLEISLTPTETADIAIEGVELSEQLLSRTLNNEMKLKRATLTTLKDMFKFGAGYGIVEPFMVTPPARVLRMAGTKGKVSTSASMEMGQAQRALRYKYASPAQVIATPDGASFNGHDRASVVFYVDPYSESQFRELMENDIFTGSAAKIIKQADDLNFNGRIPIIEIIGQLAGLKLRKSNQGNKNLPVRVPVLKCYSENQHLWIANGETIIFKDENKRQTMRCPMVQACAWPDGLRLYPSMPSTVNLAMVKAYNYFIGCLLDLMGNSWQPPLLYDRTKFPDGAPKRGPNEDIPVVGDITSAAKYMEPSRIAPEVLQVGDLMKRLYGEAVNQPEFLNNATPGVMRGGGFAFGDLTRNTTVRDALVNTILESSFINDIVEQTLILMQSDMPSAGRKITKKAWKGSKRVLETLTITPDDFVHAFEFEIDTSKKFLKSPQGQQQANQWFAQMKDDPYADRWEVRKIQGEMIFGEELSRRMLPMEQAEAQKMQQQEQEMVMAERAKNLAAGAAAPQQASGMGPESGALMGAGATALAGGAQ